MKAEDLTLSVPALSVWHALFIGYINELMSEL